MEASSPQAMRCDHTAFHFPPLPLSSPSPHISHTHLPLKVLHTSLMNLPHVPLSHTNLSPSLHKPCTREREREVVTEATQSGGVLTTRGSNDNSI